MVILPPDGNTNADDLKEAMTEPGPMTQSGAFDGLAGDEAKQKVCEHLQSNNIGKATVQFRLRDWGVSRQRYWGTPVPIIFCEQCGTVPVPYERPAGDSTARRAIGRQRSVSAQIARFVYQCSMPEMQGSGETRDRHPRHLHLLVVVFRPLHLAA